MSEDSPLSSDAGTLIEQEPIAAEGATGSLELIDPATGKATVIFASCTLKTCRVGASMHADGSEGTIDTSAVTALIPFDWGYEIHTHKGKKIYRLKRITDESPPPSQVQRRVWSVIQGFLRRVRGNRNGSKTGDRL